MLLSILDVDFIDHTIKRIAGSHCEFDDVKLSVIFFLTGRVMKHFLCNVAVISEFKIRSSERMEPSNTIP